MEEIDLVKAQEFLGVINRIQKEYINNPAGFDLFPRILDHLLAFHKSPQGFLVEKVSGTEDQWTTLALKEMDIPKTISDSMDSNLAIMKLSLGEKTIGALGFSGRTGGYHPGDDSLWSPLLQTLVQIIDSHRTGEIFRLVSQNSQDLICLHETDGRYIYVSPGVTTMLGYTQDELIGTSPYGIFHPEDLERIIQEAHQKAMKGETDNWIQYRILKKDGSYLWLETLTTPIKDSHGSIYRLQTSSRDISDRRKAEEEVKLLSLVARYTSNGVILTTTDGLVEWVNDSFTKITGYRLEEVKGKKPGAVLQGPETSEKTIHYMHDRILARLPWRCEILNYRKNGERYWIQMEGEPIFDNQGRLLKFMAVQSDVTYRKNAEVQLRKAKETAEAANKAKGQFLATMSHEIRTPMNGIMGMLDLIAAEKPTPAVMEYLSHLRSSASSLLEILNDILDFSKIEAGRLDLENIPLKLADLGQRTASLWSPKCVEKGLNFTWQIDPHVPTWILGDALRLGQILNNLLSNALKFTAKGEINLDIGLSEQGPKGKAFFFRVSDTGIGISKEKQPLIFQSFTQGDNSTSREYGGTGLGLTICRKIVTQMKGTLTVTSQLGNGSTFTATIPYQDSTEQGDEIVTPSDLSTSYQGRVLVAEDNNLNVLIIRKLLESIGLEVQVAQDGESAVQMALSEEWAMIFMDIHMPIMDGLEATRKIRERQHDPCPIIALTADAMKGDKERCLEAGMDDYIPKPFKKNEILAVLAKFLN